MTSPDISWNEKPSIKQIRLRSTLVGLYIGSLVLISNFQFGLQTGWVSMMSLPSALLGCAIFKNLWPILFSNYEPFTDVENVYVQSVAVAVGTGPLAYGFIGIIPAIEKLLTKEESGGTREQGEPFTLSQLLLWSLSLAYFGIFFAVPLRKQVIIREKLPFPSGSATATLIGVLNESKIMQEVPPEELRKFRRRQLSRPNGSLADVGDELPLLSADQLHKNHNSIKRDDSVGVLRGEEFASNFLASSGQSTYQENINTLSLTFIAASAYTLITHFIPWLTAIPLFGSYLSKTYLWNVQLSPAYIGQGMIMGLPTVSYILVGCILGWGILAPLARYMKWINPGADVNDWENGVQGWILWSSLSIMIADSLVGLIVFSVRTFVKFMLVDSKAELLSAKIEDAMESALLEDHLDINDMMHCNASSGQQSILLASSERDNEVDSKHLVRYTTVVSGLVLSCAVCVLTLIYLFGAKIIPLYAVVTSLCLAIFLSVLGVRALGETDLNPVSGVGKLSQIVLAFIVPRDHKAAVLINLVSGAVAEAGAQQAGDLMQDLKTGHLLGASPRAQFLAQLIGGTWSIILSSIVYLFYNKVYDIPNEQFKIPTAVVWIDCARLVTGAGLPDHALECSLVLGVIFAFFSLIKNCLNKKWTVYIPSGVATGVGIYSSPSFSIARFMGGIFAYWWLRKLQTDLGAKTKMIVFSSGLVLGEGVCSILNMILTTLHI
ncbi:HER012Wp [Eremothecium sinecaudum]|uniref:HER012Wp n=1 Tax=Eremothecium sinecaudum TaxID=45286 RepID=A0A0X8HTQ8_9SACH|nr:HER012Wp [Eremothecium sinecaudum]AMD21291.1 HER012Wp [Eremothecium sinecaudum]